MRLAHLCTLAAVLAMPGCKDWEIYNPLSAPTAESVCKQIYDAGVASNCRESTPGGLGAAASTRWEFDLRHVPGKGGSVFAFEDESSYTQTVIEYGKFSALSGPHRYGNKKKRIFVQISDQMGSEDAQAVKSIIKKL